MRRNRTDPRMVLGAILIVTALVYSRSLGNKFVFDDVYWTINPYIRYWSFLWQSLANDLFWFRDPGHLPQSPYYRPLTSIWLWLNFHLFGLNPAGWHSAAIALHLLVVWLVFRVGSLLTADRWAGLLVAALFALMPVHAEAVIWCAAGSSLLAAAFELGAFDFYLRLGSDGGPSGRRTVRFGLSLALFGGALLSYDSAVVFPALIAAHAFISPPLPLFCQKGQGRHFPACQGEGAAATIATSARHAVSAAWPYALEAAAYVCARFWVLGAVIGRSSDNNMTEREIALTVPGAIANYAILATIPWRAGPAHRLDIVPSAAAAQFCLPVFGLVVLSGVAFLLLRRHPHRRLYLFCAAWILVALTPVLNLGGLHPGDLVHDRYLYFPSAGFCVMVADLAIVFAQGSESRAKMVRAGAAAAMLGYVFPLFFVQRFWHDDVTLYSRFIQETPEAGGWHGRLAFALEQRGDFGGASRELKAALALQAGAPPKAYAYLALISDLAGDPQEAEAALKDLRALPGGGELAAIVRAGIMLRHNDQKGAEETLRQWLRQNPDSAETRAALGEVLSSGHRYAEALEAYQGASRIVPGDPKLHYHLALMLYRLGRNREAHDECARVLAATPDDPDARALMAALERGGGKR